MRRFKGLNLASSNQNEMDINVIFYKTQEEVA